MKNPLTLAKKLTLSYIYLDKGKNNSVIFVAGPGRSGTTWLCELLAELYNYRMIFEPFWHLHIKENGIEDFFHHSYIPGNDNSHNESIKYVLSGKYRDWKTNRNQKLVYNGRVIKDICSNLYLHKIKEIYPQVPIIFITRHPCAVVYSRLNKKNWASEWGRHAHLFNQQKNLLRDFGINKMEPADELEDHTITYCYENLPLKSQNNFYFTYYEKLLLDPGELNNIVDYINNSGLTPVKNLNKLKSKFSLADPESINLINKNKRKHARKWQEKLSKDEIKRIKQIVDRFGLDFIYKDIENI